MTFDLHSLAPAVAATAIVGVGGFHIHARSFRQIIKNRVSEDTLVSFGTLAALLQSFALWIRGSENTGFKVPAVAMAVYLVSRFTIDRIWRKAFSPGIETYAALQGRSGSRGPERTSKLQKLTDALNNRGLFVTIVMVIAVVGAGVRFYLSDNPDLSFNVFISIILSASPWALAVAVPSARLTGLAAADRRGVLFRSFEAISGSSAVKLICLLGLKGETLSADDSKIIERLKGSGLEVLLGAKAVKDSPQAWQFDSREGGLVSRRVNLPNGLRDLPLALVSAWLIGRAVWFQLAWALVYNIAVLVASVLGFLSPLWVIPLMCGSVFVIILNSLILAVRLKNVEA